MVKQIAYYHEYFSWDWGPDWRLERQSYFWDERGKEWTHFTWAHEYPVDTEDEGNAGNESHESPESDSAPEKAMEAGDAVAEDGYESHVAVAEERLESPIRICNRYGKYLKYKDAKVDKAMENAKDWNDEVIEAMNATEAMKATDTLSAAGANSSVAKTLKLKPKAMTAAETYELVAAVSGLKPKDVKAAVEGLLALGAAKLKKNGSFNLADMFDIRLIPKSATKARKGKNQFTKRPYVIKANPASKTVSISPTKKFKEMVN